MTGQLLPSHASSELANTFRAHHTRKPPTNEAGGERAELVMWTATDTPHFLLILTLSPFKKKNEKLLQGPVGFHPKLSKQTSTVAQVQILPLPFASYGKWLDLVAPPLDGYGSSFCLSFLIYKMETMIMPTPYGCYEKQMS